MVVVLNQCSRSKGWPERSNIWNTVVKNCINCAIDVKPSELKELAEYEEKVGAVTENTINYLIATLGLTEDMDASVLAEEIENAMIEDCADSVMVKEMLFDKDKREELF